MKTGTSKRKNLIASNGIDGSHPAELLKEAWRTFRSLLKSSPSLIKMDVAEKLKVIHLLRRNKRKESDLMHSTSTVLTLDHLSNPVHDTAAVDKNLSLMIGRICDGGGASGGCSLSNTVSVEEIDDLADAFISRFYNNVRLEKQQSYRMYQDMLARGT